MTTETSKARKLLKTVSVTKAASILYSDELINNGKKGYCAEYEDKVLNLIGPLCRNGVFSSPKDTLIENIWSNCCRTLDSWGVINRSGSGYHELTDQAYTILHNKVGRSYLDKVVLSIYQVDLENKLEYAKEENKTFREVITDLVTKQQKIKELLD